MLNNFYKRLLSDRPLNWSLRLMAYLLLVLAVIYRRPEGVLTDVVVVLLGIAVVFFIVRVVMLISGKALSGFRAGGVMDAVNKNITTVATIGYILLLGLIIEPHMKEMWVVYALAALFAVAFIVSVIATFKRGSGISQR